MQQIIIEGNLGSDPEARYTTTGDMVANFNVATTEKWTDKQGNKQERTIWFKVVAWRKQAETVSTWLKKGSRVMVMGTMEEPQPWIDQDSREARCKLTVRMDKFFFTGSAPRQDNGDSAPRNTTSRPAPAHANGGRAPYNGPDDSGPTDEDIPF